MQPNPVLKRLGLSENDRAVIIHVDDVGMCQATVSAYADLLDFGLISSAAVMVPCPWFPQTAAFCREHHEADMGIHLTVNSEWDGYRWGPVSTRDMTSGLMDDEGYFHRRQPAVQANADPEAVRAELDAQINRALTAGIDATHVDSHMGTVMHPRFVASYRDLALQYKLPPGVLLRGDEDSLWTRGLTQEQIAMGMKMTAELEARGVPLLDNIIGMPLEEHENRVERAKSYLEALQPGTITHLLMHAAQDTPELRAIAPDWRARVADYQAFLSADLRDFLRNKGIHVIGYRVIRDLMRA
jgi:predicted glycoside hydrolase/deacetylase ChbG (UPF0249 family)